MPPPISPEWFNDNRPLPSNLRPPGGRRSSSSTRNPNWDIIDSDSSSSSSDVSQADTLTGHAFRNTASTSQESDSNPDSSDSSLDDSERSELAALRRLQDRQDSGFSGFMARSLSAFLAARAEFSADSDAANPTSRFTQRGMGFWGPALARILLEDEATLAEDISRFREDIESSDSDFESNVVSRISYIARSLLFAPSHQDTRNEGMFTSPHRFAGVHSSNETVALNGGVPLRRQNAVRRGVVTLSTPSHDEKINSLYRLSKNLLRDIKHHDPSFGSSPLFTDSHIWKNSFCAMLCGPISKHQANSLDARMSDVLRRRNTRVPEERYRNDAKEKSFDEVKLKRKCHFEAETSEKRRRIRSEACSKTCEIGVSDYFRLGRGDNIPVKCLSPQNKGSILSGLHSSFLKAGSEFHLTTDPKLSPRCYIVSLIMTDVCYESAHLNGFFKQAQCNKSDGVSNLKSFITFLIGDVCKNNDKLRDPFNDILTAISTIEKQSKSNSVFEQFKIPFSGTVVNFKDHDLEFWKDSIMEGNDRSSGQKDRVRSQMGEWLKFKPFNDLSKVVFMNSLELATSYLKTFAEVPKNFQKTILQFCTNLIDESWLITKTPSSTGPVQSSVLQRSKELCQHMSFSCPTGEGGSQLEHTEFTKRWNRGVCDKLVGFAACIDPCLLNLQLNYILLTLRVDLYATMSMILRIISDKLPAGFDRNKFKATLIETRKLVLLCSINRKTGQLEMLRTRSELVSKSPSRNSPIPSEFDSSEDSETSSDDSDFESASSQMYDAESCFTSPTRGGIQLLYGAQRITSFSAAHLDN